MADITAGKIFTSGEQNITHTKLNDACAGTVNTTFHTGKVSIGSSPASGTTEMLVYDTASSSFKKGTLSQLALDHTGLIVDRTAKAIPVTGDILLIADSAAGNALKSMTAGALIHNAAAHSTPIAADKIPIYNSAGAALGSITLLNLIDLLASHALPVTADRILVAEAGGAVRKMTLGNLVAGAVAITVPTAAMVLPIHDGADFKKVALSVLISGLGASVTAPAGTEILQTLDGATLKKLLLSDLKTYARAGLQGNYLYYREQQVSGTDGGTFTAGAWQTRTITTEVSDVGGHGSVAANQITLAAGTYRCKIRAPGQNCNSHQAKLYNITDAADEILGTSERSGTTVVSHSFVSGRFTIAASKVFEVQHRCSTNAPTTGFGSACSFGTEVYTEAEFWKEA